MSKGHWCMMGPNRSQTEQPCLEGLAAQRGARVWEDPHPQSSRWDVGRRSMGERWGWGRGCLGVLRGRYLHSVFAWHPWHAPFSLKEETETMRRGPDSGPPGLSP